MREQVRTDRRRSRSHAEISKSAAERAVDALIGAVTSSLQKGEMRDAGRLRHLLRRQAPRRTGRNPRTGEAIAIKAARRPKFRAGKALKDA